MENWFSKLGMYEIFSEIITGMIVSLMFFLFFPIDIKLRYIFINRDLIDKIVSKNDLVTVICWLLIAYLLGMIIHQLASMCERRFKIRDNMKENFVVLKKVYDNYEEIYKYMPYIKEELRRNGKSELSDEDKVRYAQKSYFGKALIYVEDIEKKEGKNRSTRLDSIYAMSRNLSCSFAVMGILFLAFKLWMGVIFLLIAVTLYFKACNDAKLRTRYVLNRYRSHLEES